jgi:hypothetical protein
MDKVFSKRLDSITCILSLVVISFFSQWHFIINVIGELASVLGIRVFRVKSNLQNLETASICESEL